MVAPTVYCTKWHGKGDMEKKVKKQILKRYWFLDWRDDTEYVYNAYSVKDLKKRIGTDRLKILNVYHRKGLKESEFLMPY